ncbi:hypothetical protein N9933_02180 [bacterium]|nr:hypothetical protein [bacterium]
MEGRDQQFFHQLKEALLETFISQHPECKKPIWEWKGQEIIDFQEDLQKKVKGRISEKWFYTHIKTEKNERLPRIDILNMLSEYAGFRNWNDFVHRQAPEPIAVDISTPIQVMERAIPKTKPFWQKSFGWIGIAMVAGLGILAVMSFQGENAYRFCFVDADTGKNIDQEIEVIILKKGESPETRACDKEGCYEWKGKPGTLTFEVRAPYYKPDTVRRVLDDRGGEEQIELKTDDYALMIHLFSTGNLKDWKKRRNQLNGMIAPDARIFQVYGGGTKGMALYNKEEFIDKMTMPLKSLKNIEILETIYNNSEEIHVMRFIQKEAK